MSTAALFARMATVLAGLVLLVIWLIEYDREFQNAAATRLPVPVISAHALPATFSFWPRPVLVTRTIMGSCSLLRLTGNLFSAKIRIE